MQIGSLFFKIGGKTDDLDNSLKKSELSVALFEAKVLAALYAVDRFVERSTAGAIALHNLAAASGIASDELSKMGIAASLSNAGVAAEDANKQFAAFAQNLYQIKTFGQGNMEGFKALSFLTGSTFNPAATNTPLAAIKQISGAIKNLNDQQAVDIIGKMGFSPALLSYFRDPAKFDELADKLKQDKDQTDTLKDLGNSINELKISLGKLSDAIVTDLAPPLKTLINSISSLVQALTFGHPIDWVKKNVKEAIPEKSSLPTLDDLRDKITKNGSLDDSQDKKNVKEAIPEKSSLPTLDDLRDKITKNGSLEKILRTPVTGDGSAFDINGALDAYEADKTLKKAAWNSAGKSGNSANVTQNNNISVHGSGDPHATAAAVIDSQQQLNHALTDQINGSLR